MNSYVLKKVDDIIMSYGSYDADYQGPAITYDEVPDVSKMELAALFLLEDKSRAYEALSENQYLDSKIIPALVNLLSKPGSRDAQYDITEALQESLVDYYRLRTIEALEFRMEFIAWDNKLSGRD